jgi:hypothetical protein
MAVSCIEEDSVLSWRYCTSSFRVVVIPGHPSHGGEGVEAAVIVWGWSGCRGPCWSEGCQNSQQIKCWRGARSHWLKWRSADVSERRVIATRTWHRLSLSTSEGSKNDACVSHLGLSTGPDLELAVDMPHSHFPSLVTLCAQNFVPSAPAFSWMFHLSQYHLWMERLPWWLVYSKTNTKSPLTMQEKNATNC